MLARITSLADFFRKAETDDRYKDIAIKAHCNACCKYTSDWNLAKSWIDNWVRTNVAEDKRCKTCASMVDYLNRRIA